MRPRLLLPAVAAAICLAAPAAGSAAPSAAPGQVVVAYRPSTSRSARLEVLHSAGLRTAASLPGDVRTLAVPRGSSVRATLRRLRHDPAVAYAVPDYRVHAADFIPNDPGKAGPGGWQALQWNFSGPAGVGAPAAWDIARAAGVPGGRGVTVAVIDSGVAYENYKGFRRSPDFAATTFTKNGYDWIDHDRHPDDEESHGTHVTGTIAEATDNAFGVTGLAYGVKIMPLRVLDSSGNGDGSNIARAIRYAVKHGAQVINMSVEFDTSLRAHDIPEVISALRYATQKRVALVAASGNEGVGKVAYPAHDSDVISVGATTADGCLADYSNTGRGLNLVAPGGGQDAPLAADPYDQQNCDPASADRRVIQETLYGSPRRFRLVGFEGTSFATPHVTAAIALLLATKRLGGRPTPAAIRARLMQTARDLGPVGYDSHYGAGLLNIPAALGP